MHLDWFRAEKAPQGLIDSGLCCLFAARAGKNVVRVSTSLGIAKRLRLMQTNCHLFVTLDALVWLETRASAARAEADIHAVLRRVGTQLRGDWFRVGQDEVVKAFESLCDREYVITPHAQMLEELSISASA